MSSARLFSLLNMNEAFTNQDLVEVVGILDNDPQAASTLGSHGRSTIWMCAQHSDCPFRSKILPPLLVIHGADVNRKADREYPFAQSVHGVAKTERTSAHARHGCCTGASVPCCGSIQ